MALFNQQGQDKWEGGKLTLVDLSWKPNPFSTQVIMSHACPKSRTCNMRVPCWFCHSNPLNAINQLIKSHLEKLCLEPGVQCSHSGGSRRCENGKPPTAAGTLHFGGKHLTTNTLCVLPICLLTYWFSSPSGRRSELSRARIGHVKLSCSDLVAVSWQRQAGSGKLASPGCRRPSPRSSLCWSPYYANFVRWQVIFFPGYSYERNWFYLKKVFLMI